MNQIKLASLEMHGYKTFARQTVLRFPANTTAIVGPNGSGKSNVADAIRWVLGEQSYSLLRAKKTEDMIYIGSDQRARAGMASVSITFNNETNWLPIDYNEVVLTRRAYRDGTNEYLLNNQRVRLKDFHELLAKTGLSDRTYTIIGQGLVDLALSIKPDERSKLFEEAAGIGLYRSRKEEALKRLESTQRNLERALDIVDEIRPRLRSLERQAARVGEYKKVQESLQEKLRAWYGYHWFKAQEEIARLKQELEAAEESSARALALLQQNQETSASLKESMAAQREMVNQLHQRLGKLHDAIQAANRDLAVNDEREQSLVRAQAQIGDDLAKLEETLESAEKTLELMRQEAEKETQTLAQLQEKRRQIEAELTEERKKRKDLQTRQNDLQTRLVNLDKEALVLKSRRNEIVNRLESLQRGLKSSSEILETITKDEQNAAETRRNLENKLAEHERQLLELDNQRKAHQDNQLKAKREREENSAQINRLNLEKNKLTNQLQLMRQAQESMAGFSEGAKTFLQHPRVRRYGKKITDLASKLEVSEKYEKAVSSALGEAVDLLILPEDRLDKDLLTTLAAYAESKVALIGLEGLSQAKAQPAPSGEGILGSAVAFVQAPESISALVEHLLSQYLLVETLDHALSLPGKVREAYNLVTLNGEVLLRSGIAVLGKQKSASKVSFVRTRKELEEALVVLEQKLIELAAKDSEYQRVQAETDQQVTRIQNEQRSLEKQINELRRELNTALVNLDKAQNRRKWTEKQIEDNEQEKARLESEQTALKEKAEAVRLQMENLNKSLDELKNSMEEQTLDDLEHQYQYLQMECRVQEQALLHTQETIKSLERRVVSDRERKGLLNQRSSANNEELATLRIRKAEFIEAIRRLNAEVESVRANELSVNQEQLRNLEAEYKVSTEAEAELQKDLSFKERQTTHIQLELGRKMERLENLRSHIEDDFGLIELEYRNEYSVSTPLPFPDMVIETLTETPALPAGIEEEMRDLKNHLRRIGVVNFEAENEYNEVKNRYENLTAQISDLQAAIVDIQSMISELNEVMQRDFLNTFKSVSAEFSKMFARLFNGGSARLILSDESSPIEGGIEIEARLPGKREQGLVLLSGGERSLTAVALVFALLKISPTPFCVLDEVDAMLDESNVGRFIELLKDLSNETQFLLITHNRNTVQAADVIYGVTMGKDGASQIISLRLDEVDESYVK
ncbi:MAG: chromosome segregation protein SMC [Chloroflexi bacterium]|jgi:chromosome segregation protein|nr:chromosome segregation protein SMC [Chloroflexota bacterium]HQK03546.1 chromosome segregation protein SMC [Anaerolineaceae bacterium]